MKMVEWFIYVVVADDCRKIGITQDVESRVRTLQTGNAQDIKLETVFVVGSEESARLIERRCHDALKFAGAHVRGEWFSINAQLAKNAITACARQHCMNILLVFSNKRESRRAKRLGKPLDALGLASFLRNNKNRLVATALNSQH